MNCWQNVFKDEKRKNIQYYVFYDEIGPKSRYKKHVVGVAIIVSMASLWYILIYNWSLKWLWLQNLLNVLNVVYSYFGAIPGYTAGPSISLNNSGRLCHVVISWLYFDTFWQESSILRGIQDFVSFIYNHI